MLFTLIKTSPLAKKGRNTGGIVSQFFRFLKDLVWQLEGDEKKIAVFLGISRSQLQKWDKKNANLLTPFRLKNKPISSV